MSALPTGTVTFLFTDVEGSTRLWERHPDQMRAALARHDHLIESLAEEHQGVVVRPRGEGDSRFAVFPRASDAAAAAAAIQQALHQEPWPAETPLRVRMALHTGEADLREGDYYGSAVNRCARLRAIAHGGQTVLSVATYDLVRDTLLPGVRLRDLGEHLLSDLARPERVFQLGAPGLAADFPPLRSLDALPHNLPLQLTSFVGRERELAEVAGLLATHRLVSLTGVGGTGKTRLALQVGADALPAYPDGVWLVALDALRDPALVPQAVATAAGVREEQGRALVTTLVDALKPKRVLLLLDNCEHLLDAAARLTDTLLRACPHLTILATSREALGIAGETVWRVPSLAVPAVPAGQAPPVETLTQFAAITLFVERAQAVQPHFSLATASAPAVVALCALLDGIPLAIELAAARVRALSVEQLLARLEDRFRLLTGGSRTALERHQTLQATVDWSHALLTAAERVLFRRLAVFAGSWSLEAAEAVCPDGDGANGPAERPGGGVARDDLLDLLTRLVDKSLVLADAPTGPAAGPTRYRLLETLRQYAQHKLMDAEEVAAVRTRHAAHYLALAEQAAAALHSHEQLVWLDRLEEEHANLLAALAWLAERAERATQGESAASEAAAAPEAALRLGAALTTFWTIRNHFALAWEWLERLLALPGAHRTVARARALAGAAHVAFWRRDYTAERRLATEALAAAEEVGDGEGAAHAHFSLGILAGRAGDATTARMHLEASRLASAALGSPAGEAYAVVFLANMAFGAGDEPGAARLAAEAEALARPTGDTFALSTILWNRANLARRVGDYSLARRLLEEALALRRAQRDPRAIAEALAALGWVALAAGDAAAARRWLAQVVVVYRDTGFRWFLPLRLRDLARVAEAQGDLERAARLWGAAAAQYQAIVGRPLRADEGPPSDIPVQAVESLRARLGNAAFDAAWAEGQAMSLEQAVAYALEEAPKPPSRPPRHCDHGPGGPRS